MILLPLTPNPNPPEPYEFIGFDTEGSGALGDFKLAAAYDDDGPHVFYKREDLVPFLFKSSNRGKRIVAANLEYDWATAFQPFDEHHHIVVTASKWLTAVYRDASRHSWVAWDLQRIVPLSVEEMGDRLDLPKWPTPPQLLTPPHPPVEFWSCDRHHRTWCVECYCVRDAEIVYRMAGLFQSVLNKLGGQMRPTTAGCAMDLFRRRFLTVEVPPTLPENNTRARAAYFGGRCETFRVGTARDVNYYDVNSLFPSVYRDLEVGDPSTYHRIAHPRELGRYLDKFGQVDATVEVPRGYLGALPTRVGVRPVYPTETVAGSWVLSELSHAIDHGAVVKSLGPILYADRTIRPFRKYVDALYKLRRQMIDAGRPDEYCIKLLMNGLYGKFGQHPERPLQKLITPAPGYDLEDFSDCEPASIAGHDVFLKDELAAVQSPHMLTLWSAAITAAARVKMFDLLDGFDGGLYYSDTDSIHTTRKLKTSDELGGLKLVEHFLKVTYYAPKEYRYIAKDGRAGAKVKGVPDALKDAYLKGRVVEFAKPVHTLTAIATGGRIAEWKVRTVSKRASPPTRWHKPIDDYNRPAIDTRPYTFGEAIDVLGTG